MADFIICVSGNLFRIYLISRFMRVFLDNGKINFLIVSLYNMLSDAIFQQYENEVLCQKVQGYANQLDLMLQGEEKLKAMRHDMKHHLNELKILAAKEGDGAIEKYIGSMEEFMANPNEIISCGNLEIDSVLNYMLSKAKQELRAVNVNVRLPESVSHSFDINVILGNLLENGIEAARQTEGQRLDVGVELQQGFLRIQVEAQNAPRLSIYRKVIEKNQTTPDAAIDGFIWCCFMHTGTQRKYVSRADGCPAHE